MTRPDLTTPFAPRVTRHDDGIVEILFEDVSPDWRPAPGLDGVEFGWAKGEALKQRLSDGRLTNLIECYEPPRSGTGATVAALALDLRDARAALAQSPDRIVGVRWRDDALNIVDPTPTQRAVAEERERCAVFYVVERDGRYWTFDGPTKWEIEQAVDPRYGFDDHWVSDIHRAAQFCNAAHAKQFVSYVGYQNASVTEHAYIRATPPGAPPPRVADQSDEPWEYRRPLLMGGWSRWLPGPPPWADEYLRRVCVTDFSYEVRPKPTDDGAGA